MYAALACMPFCLQEKQSLLASAETQQHSQRELELQAAQQLQHLKAAQEDAQRLRTSIQQVRDVIINPLYDLCRPPIIAVLQFEAAKTGWNSEKAQLEARISELSGAAAAVTTALADAEQRIALSSQQQQQSAADVQAARTRETQLIQQQAVRPRYRCHPTVML